MSDKKKSKFTISDVAKMAGVSVTTVSRVLNGEKYVRTDKKEAVEKAVAKLDYQPNIYARSLAGDRSYLIGLLFDDPRGDYLSGMQRGAMLSCRDTGRHIVVEIFDRKSTFEQIEAFLTKIQLFGVILTPPVCDNKTILAALSKKQIPTVRISPSEPYPGMACVKIDDYSAAKKMVDYLISLGHEDIGFIVGDREHADARIREKAFRDTMIAAGLTVNENWIGAGTYQFDSGLVAARHILQGPVKPSAIFASNDDMASAVLVVADEQGLSVPSDLSVAGFDDMPLAASVSPALTTIRQPVEQLAKVAVSLLEKIIEGVDGATESVEILDICFIERQSTAVFPKKN